ncbi:hypothetical protein ZIOFF_048398 [Zingiber officinale]|uniref:ZF-HD dimerization-type domain-containing protein n=1 Tax=Zingiber officinale TaxID=94328 RepID=A0A8J5KUA5_ZINOF|nr:hypothetical protein ZIOFF_048398 [Zingiber officinale]
MMKRHLVVLRRYEPAGRVHGGGGRKQGGKVRYAECRKNHAAATGGYAVDGCGEFIASVGEGAEAELRCAACGCHRSFHRREADSAGHPPPANARHFRGCGGRTGTKDKVPRSDRVDREVEEEDSSSGLEIEIAGKHSSEATLVQSRYLMRLLSLVEDIGETAIDYTAKHVGYLFFYPCLLYLLLGTNWKEAFLYPMRITAISSGTTLVSGLIYNTLALPIRAEEDNNQNDPKGEGDNGAFGTIKSIFDPDEKTKTGKLLPKAYLKDAREVVKTLRESLEEDVKDASKFRRSADAAKESIRQYLSNWKGQSTVVAEESYAAIEKAIRTLANFYSKEGPFATMTDEGVEEEIVEAWHIKDSEEEEDHRLPKHCEPKEFVSLHKLEDLHPERLPNFEQILKKIFVEHLHLDDEISYCIQGSGYHDVRDENDRWIRIAVKEGVMILLPAGIYHRLALDLNNYLKILIFNAGPAVGITTYERPGDDLPARKLYLETLHKKGC